MVQWDMEKAQTSAKIAGYISGINGAVSVGELMHVRSARFDYGQFIVASVHGDKVALAFPIPNDPREGKMPMDFL